MINNARCTLEMKYKIAMAKVAFHMGKSLFSSKLDLNLRRNWQIATFGTYLLMGQKFGHFGKFVTRKRVREYIKHEEQLRKIFCS
jgi:hypothetical protein